MNTSRVAAGIFVFSIGSMLCAQDVLIETGAGGQNADRYTEIKGEWSNSQDPQSEKSQAPGLTAGVPARRTTAGQQPVEARYNPMFSAPGLYYVYVTWPKAANSKQVIYMVKHAGGETPRAVIQNGVGFRNPANGNKWIYLGEYHFNAGEDQYLDLVSDAGNTAPNDSARPGLMFADGVRFTMKPLTPPDGVELLPRDRVELRALPAGSRVPSGALPLLTNAPAGLVASTPAPAVAGASTPKAVAPVVPAGVAPPLTAAASGPPGVVNWINDLAQARQQATAQPNKRILIYFYAPGSDSNNRYEKEVFISAELAKVINEKYFPVKLNIADSGALAAALGVYRGGVFLVYDSAGNGVKRIDEARDAGSLLWELMY